ncbi:hypothetical protein BGZ57DRAFT_983496 [Hyaloscypha finlandica]|nr:hypothetical protein BGZ57DRAFT_983496 [Hyaloscypha finlandica]
MSTRLKDSGRPGLPAFIEDEYENSISRQLAVLRLMRPHRGALLDNDGDLSQPTRAREYLLGDSTCYVYITVARELMSMGLKMNAEESTGAESVMHEMVRRDIGWNAMEDYLVKGSILKALYNNESLTEADVKPEDWTYEKIGPETGTSWHSSDSPQPHSQYVLNWSGSNSLAECIQESAMRKGELGKTYIFPSECPDYIRVHYKPESRTFRPFSEMRHVNVELIVAVEISATPRKLELRKQAATYNPDDVRTYWKTSHEIVPSPTGIVQEKDFEASLPRCTVADEGRFDLYYYRVLRDERSDPGWSGIDESAPEFEQREWVMKERESQALRSPTSSGMQPSIENEDTADIPASSATSTDQLQAYKENPFEHPFREFLEFLKHHRETQRGDRPQRHDSPPPSSTTHVSNPFRSSASLGEVARGATTAAKKSHQNLAFTARDSAEHLSGERSGRCPSEQEGKSTQRRARESMDSPAKGSNSQKIGERSTAKVTTQKKPLVLGANKTSTEKSSSRKATTSREGPAAPEATVNKSDANRIESRESRSFSIASAGHLRVLDSPFAAAEAAVMAVLARPPMWREEILGEKHANRPISKVHTG